MLRNVELNLSPVAGQEYIKIDGETAHGVCRVDLSMQANQIPIVTLHLESYTVVKGLANVDIVVGDLEDKVERLRSALEAAIPSMTDPGTKAHAKAVLGLTS